MDETDIDELHSLDEDICTDLMLPVFLSPKSMIFNEVRSPLTLLIFVLSKDSSVLSRFFEECFRNDSSVLPSDSYETSES